MNWAIYIKPKPRKDLAKFPSKDREKILSALEEMEADPLSGDVVSLGDGRVRRRVGSYRIFFERPRSLFIVVYKITRRTSKTYK